MPFYGLNLLLDELIKPHLSLLSSFLQFYFDGLQVQQEEKAPKIFFFYPSHSPVGNNKYKRHSNNKCQKSRKDWWWPETQNSLSVKS